MSTIKLDDAEEFLQKVKEVEEQVKGLLNGSISIDEVDQKLKDQEMLKKYQEEQKKIKEEEKFINGRKGKGHKSEYKSFWANWFTEYDIELGKCTHWKHETITKEERMDYLKSKLEELKERRKTKKERKAKFDLWIKTQAMFYKKTSTNYKKWEYFESDSTSSDSKEPILPEHDPGFKAMEADMNDRRKRKIRDTKEANVIKERGNQRLKLGLYKTAERDYTDALELRKDILPLYTNRALARLKLENWLGAIDDCTRVIEYCEVFEGEAEKNKDLMYKAFLRRAQAFRGQRDYSLAKIDLEQAMKLFPDEKDAQKYFKLNEEDIELDERIKRIMQQRDGLNDKEYIDFTISYLRGQKDEDIKIEEGKTETSYCVHPITEEDSQKLAELLTKSEDLILYFIKNKGFDVIKDSFKHNTLGLSILEKILPLNDKIREEFQKAKGYEALIDYLHSRSSNHETQNLESSLVKNIFSILEDATLNEFIRNQLSDKKKIKDLFISVLKALDLKENTALIATLISFGSNLCFGKYEARFREYLKKDFGDLMNLIVNMVTFILENLKEDRKVKEEINEMKSKKLKKKEKKELEKRENKNKQGIADRTLLKQILWGFIANLAMDAEFRKFFSSEEFLEYIVELFRIEEEYKNFDWLDSIERILAVLINWSVASEAQEYLGNAGIMDVLENVWSKTFYCEEQKTIITRLMYLLSRIVSQPKILLKIVSSKVMMIRIFLYFNRQFPELIPHVLKVIYSLWKLKEELAKFTTEHEINVNNFVKETREMLKENIDTWNREKFINISGLISAFLDWFPSTTSEYGSLIPDLTLIIKDKVDMERKNAAILIAKLAKDEDLKKEMAKYHTMEILMSLGGNLNKIS